MVYIQFLFAILCPLILAPLNSKMKAEIKRMLTISYNRLITGILYFCSSALRIRSSRTDWQLKGLMFCVKSLRKMEIQVFFIKS